jgi:hypothetical protein
MFAEVSAVASEQLGGLSDLGVVGPGSPLAQEWERPPVGVRYDAVEAGEERRVELSRQRRMQRIVVLGSSVGLGGSPGGDTAAPVWVGGGNARNAIR